MIVIIRMSEAGKQWDKQQKPPSIYSGEWQITVIPKTDEQKRIAVALGMLSLHGMYHAPC